MTGRRILQNFSGGIVHLVATDPRVAEALGPTLGRLGVALRPVAPVDDRYVLDVADLREDRDVLMVDADLDRQVDIPGHEAAPIPVIGIVGVEAPTRLKAAMQIGATAVLRKPVQGAAVYSALFMGINGFLHRRQLELRLEDHERRRRGRRTVVKAIVDLMNRAGIDDDQAYAVLRRESMRHRVSIEDYCARLARTAEGEPAVGPEIRRGATHD